MRVASRARPLLSSARSLATYSSFERRPPPAHPAARAAASARLRSRAVPTAARRFDRDDIARAHIPSHLCRHLLAVQEVPAGGSRPAAALSLGGPRPPLGDDGEAAVL